MEVRKLIAHGPSSLTVALPYKWIKKNELKKGDNVSIQEDEQGLHLSAKPEDHTKSITIDLSNHDWPGITTVITTVYRRGYDEVTIRYSTASEYQMIAQAVRLLLGFAIIENHKSRCLVKSLPSELEQSFDTLFRRVFLILIQQLEDLSEVLDSKDDLRTFFRRDADLNSIVNLAVRMINKGYIQDRFEELHLFHALLVLEECGDDITRFTIEVANEKDAAKLKESVKNCVKMVRLLYDAYFQKKAGIMEFYKQYYLYWPDEKKFATPMLDHFDRMGKDKHVFYLRSIIEKIVHLAEVLLLPQAQVEPGPEKKR